MKKWVGLLLGLAAVVGFLQLAGYFIRRSAWLEAVTKDTQESYALYLSQYPGEDDASRVKRRTDALLDEKDWAVVAENMTSDSLRKYLGERPNGAWVEFANRKLAELVAIEERLASKPEEAEAEFPAATSDAVAPGPSKPDLPKQTVQSTQLAVVQLGAFSSTASARKAWGELRGQFHSLQVAVPLVDENPWKGTKLFRLRVQVPGVREARRLCGVLIKAGYECVVSKDTSN